MRVKIMYEGRSGQVENSFPVPCKFKIKLNKMPVLDFDFADSSTVFIENAQLNKDKKNIIQFRKVEANEKEETQKAIVSNIFRGIAFVFMMILLPFGFMSFKGTNKPFSRLNFSYSETEDFVLILNPERFGYRLEDSNPDNIKKPFEEYTQLDSRTETAAE